MFSVPCSKHFDLVPQYTLPIHKTKNDLEGKRQEGSEEVWVDGRGRARSGHVEKNDMDEWKQQLIER